MIATLTGTVASKGIGHCVLDVGGVGFRLAMTTNSLAALPAHGDEVFVHTYLHVREDELSLFGFESEAEKAAFELLLGVTGVGPKVALATLSSLTPESLAGAVAAGDAALISSVPGLGKKTAQRIIVDLADKFETSQSGGLQSRGEGASAGAAEAHDALLAMGFSAAEAAAALRGFEGESSDAQTLLKYALQRLGGAG